MASPLVWFRLYRGKAWHLRPARPPGRPGVLPGHVAVVRPSTPPPTQPHQLHHQPREDPPMKMSSRPHLHLTVNQVRLVLDAIEAA